MGPPSPEGCLTKWACCPQATPLDWGTWTPSEEKCYQIGAPWATNWSFSQMEEKVIGNHGGSCSSCIHARIESVCFIGSSSYDGRLGVSNFCQLLFVNYISKRLRAVLWTVMLRNKVSRAGLSEEKRH